jgi:hypothetical protein
METSDESTNKVKRIDDPTEPAPQRRPIPSVLKRSADGAKPPPSFTWPLATPKPTPPIARTPVGARVAIPAVVRPTAPTPMRAPRGTDAPPSRVETAPAPAPVPVPVPVPVIVIPALVPAPVIVAPTPAPVIVAPTPTPAPVIVAPTPIPVPAEQLPTTFGSGMLQARARRAKPIAARDELANIPAAPTFGAGVLQARANGTKKVVIAFVVAIVTIAALCMAMRGGSHHTPAPATTQQP